MHRLYKPLALFLFAAFPAYAETPPEDLHFIGKYAFSWEGIPLAGVELAMEEGKDSYTLHLSVISSGIVNLFTRHRSDTTTNGRREGNHYFPRLYESHYWTKNKPRHIRLAFDGKGTITEELVEPPEDPRERPVVPHALKDGAIDPLSILLAMPGGTLMPHVFDGKHLYEGKAMPGAEVAIKAYDGPRNVIPYQLTRTPLAGMTQKETAQYAKGEPVLTMYFSADARHIPVYAILPIYLGYIKGTLIKECTAWDECKL